MITAADFHFLRTLLGRQAEEDIAWAQGCKPPEDADEFAREVIFVIANSGMKNTVARRIFERCMDAVLAGRSTSSAFGHTGKTAAMDRIWRDREQLFAGYMAAEDKLAFALGLPWVGPITSYHVVKNFGMDVAKPDVHLARLAKREGCTVQQLCERLAREVGLRVAAVDTVLWRACADGWLNSHTGEILD